MNFNLGPSRICSSLHRMERRYRDGEREGEIIIPMLALIKPALLD